MSSEAAADARYRPLDGPVVWAAASAGVDDRSWRDAVERLRALEQEAPDWVDMVRQGILLASAYRSGAQAGLYEADEAVVARLLAGVAGPADCGPAAEPHVLSNYAALLLAGDPEPASEASVRRLHAVACAPQVTHLVATDHGHHDHVLGHGDYKHHPNHVRTESGDWQVCAPVELVRAETARLVDALESASSASLHPAARAAYALHALVHVGPFAAGNGRVARALASAPLLGAASVPLLVPAAAGNSYAIALAAAEAGDPAVLVRLVEQCVAGLVHAVVRLRASAGAPEQAAAMERWRSRVEAAHRLHVLLPAELIGALGSHRGRIDLAWMSDLAAAEVVTTSVRADHTRYCAAPLAIRVPLVGGSVVEEILAIDAHPVTGAADGTAVILEAGGAGLCLEVRPGDVAGALSPLFRPRLDALLDRAVTALAVRVSAEDDDG